MEKVNITLDLLSADKIEIREFSCDRAKKYAKSAIVRHIPIKGMVYFHLNGLFLFNPFSIRTNGNR